MKLFIGLLIIAAGAGIFFFLRNKKNQSSHPIKKELIVGKWKLDSIRVKSNDSAGQFISFLASTDPNFYRHQYDIRKDGSILQSTDDPLKTDTSVYQWTKRNELAVKENRRDSAGEVFTVTRLTMDSLLLLSKDSAVFVFTKLK